MTAQKIETTVQEYREAVSQGDAETINELFLPTATVIECDDEGALLKLTAEEFAQDIAIQDAGSPLEFQESSTAVSIDYSREDVAIVEQQVTKGDLRFKEMLSFRKVREGWRIVGRILSGITRKRVLSPVYSA